MTALAAATATWGRRAIAVGFAAVAVAEWRHTAAVMTGAAVTETAAATASAAKTAARALMHRELGNGAGLRGCVAFGAGQRRANQRTMRQPAIGHLGLFVLDVVRWLSCHGRRRLGCGNWCRCGT